MNRFDPMGSAPFCLFTTHGKHHYLIRYRPGSALLVHQAIDRWWQDKGLNFGKREAEQMLDQLDEQRKEVKYGN